MMLGTVGVMSIFAADSPSSANKPSQDKETKLSVTTEPAGPIAASAGQAPTKTGERNISLATVSAKSAPQPTPSQNVTINLIHRLVQRGVLTQEDASELIKQAENDADQARTMAAQVRPKNPRSAEEDDPSLAPIEPPDLTSAIATQSNPTSPAENDAGDEDAVRVMYVPDIVKEQLRDEIRQEVMEKARDENWANPRVFPTWALRLSPFADLRRRYEWIIFPPGNDNTGKFPNFNAINTGAPFDVTGTTFSPQLNVDQDRHRFRIRARFGVQMDLDDGFTYGIRIATGENNGPTSTNQTLGVANGGQGGNFSKYAIWLDRAFVKYELGGKPSADFIAVVGRFDNPFFAPSEIIWDDDLGFDGLAIQGRYKVANGITPFVALSNSPVFNTELNFSSNRPDKFPSEDKWLFAAQLGTNLRFSKDFSAKIAGAYYHFENVEGKLSDPFTPLLSSDQGNTDDSRPAFAQKGNTYFPIRNIVPVLLGSPPNQTLSPQFQYFGLATPFQVADFSGTLDFSRFDPLHLTLFGEWLQNVAFDSNDINGKAINNRAGPGIGTFVGGNTGWIVGLKAGHAALEKRWDWNVGVSYRYVESDAVVDGFNDSDFGGGGTNLKGYTVFGAIALTPHIAMGLRWMSADEIAGAPLRTDILQFDFNAKF